MMFNAELSKEQDAGKYLTGTRTLVHVLPDLLGPMCSYVQLLAEVKAAFVPVRKTHTHTLGHPHISSKC